MYDGDQIIYEFEATTGDGDGSAAALKNRFLWGPNRDQLLASEDYVAAETTWTLTDNLGSVRDLITYDDVTNNVTVTGHFTYDAYGVNTSTSEFLFQFTARAFDTETGLQNNSARWYDPRLHFWISADPGGFAMGDANLHRYVGNGPTYLTDPEGLAGLQGGGLYKSAVQKALNAEEGKHKDYEYYKVMKLDKLFVKLKVALKSNVRGARFGADYLGKDRVAVYNRMTRILHFKANSGLWQPKNGPRIAISAPHNSPFVVHEMVHAYDHWMGRGGGTFSGSEETEMRAYGVQAILKATSRLRGFESNLHKFKSAKEAEKAWDVLWRNPMASITKNLTTNEISYIPAGLGLGTVERMVSDTEIQKVRDDLGVGFRARELADAYSEILMKRGIDVTFKVDGIVPWDSLK